MERTPTNPVARASFLGGLRSLIDRSRGNLHRRNDDMQLARLPAQTLRDIGREDLIGAQHRHQARRL